MIILEFVAMKRINIGGLILRLSLITLRCVIGQEHFMASFQTGLDSSPKPDKNVWLEFLDEIPPSKEFTICHWINIKFFNSGVAACLWSYCTIENKDDKMECVQMSLHGVVDTANRNLEIHAHMNHWTIIALESFHHRTWNHLCWSFSVLTGNSTFYHNGDLMKSMQVNTEGIDFAMKSSSKMHKASFIFGQEPDSIRGGFDQHQAYLGDLSEFNVWNYTLSRNEIYHMATCASFMKGNVVAWELTNLVINKKLGIHNVVMTEFSRASRLCDIHNGLVIFPQKVEYPVAKEICKIHGGSLAVPYSATENSFLRHIVEKNKDSCIDHGNSTTQNMVWLGAEKVDEIWYKTLGDDRNKMNISSKHMLNFTNFLHSASSKNSECAILRKDGVWLEGNYNLCAQLISLCTICRVHRQPVFTLKGICYTSIIDWNYYPIIDATHQIKSYEGYKKKSSILLNKKSQKWEIQISPAYSEKKFEAQLSTNTFADIYPIGRKRWLVTEPNCGLDHSSHSFAISVCNFPFEFTCDSGECVEINKRCDGRKDCNDGSDEERCLLISIPNQYRKANPPKHAKDNSVMEIDIETSIVKIDSIDTINMLVVLTIDISLTWHDNRLFFFNPRFDQDNIIPDHKSQLLWTPIRDLIHENAIVGEVVYDKYEIKLQPTSHQLVDPARVVENMIFNGSYNPLKLTQRMKTTYDCTFDVTNFPFDGQNCSFIMKIKHQKITVIKFSGNRNAVYEGPEIVGQFSIGEISSKTGNTNKSTLYTITIPMKRKFTNQLLNTFIPTLVLWFFGYSTLFIDMSDFSDRYMGAGTSLLVIVTLLGAISGDLPHTSYMKHIDVWFLWHIMSIFSILIYHIILNRLCTYVENLKTSEIFMFKTIGCMRLSTFDRMEALRRGNNVVIMIFPAINVLFYSIYFHFTLQ